MSYVNTNVMWQTLLPQLTPRISGLPDKPTKM